MEVVRHALQEMGSSMSVVVQQIYNVTDLCNDGQLRKLSAQGGRASRESAGPENVAVSAAVTQPIAPQLVAYDRSVVLQAQKTFPILLSYCY